MGYYTGNGVTSGGSDEIYVAQTLIVGAVLNVLRHDTTEVTRKSGVSLKTAQSASATLSVSGGDVTTTGWAVPVPIRNGTITKPTYSQIGDSNLYELTIEKKEFHSRLNNGPWY